MAYSTPGILTDESRWLAKLAREQRMAIHQLIEAGSGGGGGAINVTPGIIKLDGSGSLTVDPGSGTRSISMSVLSASPSSVFVTIGAFDPVDVSYAGFNASWSIDKINDSGIGPLLIEVIGPAVVIITSTQAPI